MIRDRFELVDASKLLSYVMMFSLVVPPAQAAALAPFPAVAGAASSLMGYLQFCVAATVGVVVGQFDDGAQIPMVTVIGITGLGPMAAYWLVVRRSGRRRRGPAIPRRRKIC